MKTETAPGLSGWPPPVLDPAGPFAGPIEVVSWVLFIMGAVVLTIVLIALLAIARKFIILDLGETESSKIAALAGAALALGAVHWLVRDQDRREEPGAKNAGRRSMSRSVFVRLVSSTSAALIIIIV